MIRHQKKEECALTNVQMSQMLSSLFPSLISCSDALWLQISNDYKCGCSVWVPGSSKSIHCGDIL